MCGAEIVGAEMTGATGVVAVCPPMPPVAFVVPALHLQRAEEEEALPGLKYFTPALSANPVTGSSVFPFASTAPIASAAKIIATAKRRERIPATLATTAAISKKNFIRNLLQSGR